MTLPVFTWLPGYDRSWLRSDLVAGLTVWAVLVPERPSPTRRSPGSHQSSACMRHPAHAETVSAIDITAVSMLTELADDLRRDGVELVLARDVGAVGDLVRLGQGDETQLRTYPTVRAAVDALGKEARTI